MNVDNHQSLHYTSDRSAVLGWWVGWLQCPELLHHTTKLNGRSRRPKAKSRLVLGLNRRVPVRHSYHSHPRINIDLRKAA